jgi:hypothetical protein
MAEPSELITVTAVISVIASSLGSPESDAARGSGSYWGR